ncbi:DUF3606 domain-containing protein [Mesorhizobium sp. WSM2561]|uniref:DUF3606 domain-containing protein n=1 Tax=Mesorhizobium sp. WSM2561 TaxID=1040985 RepID=UPI0004B896E4
MADDKSKRDFRDPNRVSADEDYELEYFARENGVTTSRSANSSKPTATIVKP